MPTNRTYLVSGMTCGSCAGKITDQVEQIPGVIDVDVDLASGGITLTTESPVSDEAVRRAVEHAGYRIVTN
ncbi:copper resistance protein CopZ [Rhodococcus hoagii]|uniref:heavy-metal-associated domain-containing protein n=1 Tax=Rhodococcus hoagii TaxID=43767 RepID=UPI0019FD6369|nr:heavy metal-associated domain-containing protein [Prescottella equi]NKS55498.1 copper resistance protein CopZ [Prescottella equi]WJJ14327.1 heavy metal-associated domain-containing protein [Prescottella equi]